MLNILYKFHFTKNEGGKSIILQTLSEQIISWLSLYILQIIISCASIIVGYIIYFIIKKQIQKLEKTDKLETSTSNNLTRLTKFMVGITIFTAIVIQFAESIGFLTSIFTLIGGTILGFAAMNTLGNMIAGLIIMISKPFVAGERIEFQGNISDVIEIKLIYTILEDLNGVEIHVPNQKLISEEIINYGKDGNIIRRSVKVTPGFKEDRKKVEKTLLEAASNVPEVLESPKPYVWISSFQNYAVEYNLFVFIKEVKKFPFIDSDLYKSVLDTCKKYDIDISTPLLLKKIAE